MMMTRAVLRQKQRASPAHYSSSGHRWFWCCSLLLSSPLTVTAFAPSSTSFYSRRSYHGTNTMSTRTQVSATTTSASLSSKDSTSFESLLTVPVAGDFCGYSATFDETGTLVPIPEYLVPADLLEWGQAPSALEVVVSQENTNTNNIGSSLLKKEWQRQIVTIYPAIGCGVDNLETAKTTQTWQTVEQQQQQQDDDDSSFSVAVQVPDNKNPSATTTLEVCFGWKPAAVENNNDSYNEHDSSLYRVALQVQLALMDENSTTTDGSSSRGYSISSSTKTPVTIRLERQTDETSSGGTIADGGGLDGRSVTMLLGKRLRRQAKFAEQAATTKSWTADEEEETQDTAPLLPCVFYPGDLTLAVQDSVVEIGHIVAGKARRVVQCDFSESSQEWPVVKSWTETGQYTER